jgi:hypothetical protein
VPTPNGSLKFLVPEIRQRNPLMLIRKAKGKLLAENALARMSARTNMVTLLPWLRQI